MSLAEMFLLSFAVGFSGAATPGPMILLTIPEVMRSGLVAAVLIVAGHAFAEIAATAGLYLGLLKVAANPAVTGAISLAGGAFLLVIGAMTVRDVVAGRDPVAAAGPAAAGRARTRAGIFALGVLVTIANPYWTVWWLTFGASLVTDAIAGPRGSISAFYSGHVLADFVWYFAAGLAVVAGGRFFRGRFYRGLLAACGAFLVAFGALFLARGAGAFLD